MYPGQTFLCPCVCTILWLGLRLIDIDGWMCGTVLWAIIIDYSKTYVLTFEKSSSSPHEVLSLKRILLLWKEQLFIVLTVLVILVNARYNLEVICCIISEENETLDLVQETLFNVQYRRKVAYLNIIHLCPFRKQLKKRKL